MDRLTLRMGSPALDGVRRGRFVSALVAAVIAGCGGPPTAPLTTADIPGLIGGWSWVCSSGGLAGQTTCATTTGVVQTWEFRADSVFRWVRSDTLLIEASFRVVRAGVGIHGDSIDLLYLDGSPTHFALEVPTEDELRVLDQCYDCFISTWQRAWQ